jgi:hypothetical protein
MYVQFTDKTYVYVDVVSGQDIYAKIAERYGKTRDEIECLTFDFWVDAAGKQVEG